MQASEPGFLIPLALFLTYNAYNLAEYMDCRLSARAWWNNHRMQRIVSSSAWLLAFLTVVLKTLGLSETVFGVTCKEQDGAPDGGDPERFTFDSSPVFVPPTALTILTVVAIAVGGVAGGLRRGGGRRASRRWPGRRGVRVLRLAGALPLAVREGARRHGKLWDPMER